MGQQHLIGAQKDRGRDSAEPQRPCLGEQPPGRGAVPTPFRQTVPGPPVEPNQEQRRDRKVQQEHQDEGFEAGACENQHHAAERRQCKRQILRPHAVARLQFGLEMHVDRHDGVLHQHEGGHDDDKAGGAVGFEPEHPAERGGIRGEPGAQLEEKGRAEQNAPALGVLHQFATHNQIEPKRGNYGENRGDSQAVVERAIFRGSEVARHPCAHDQA
jgi:hypothetical protein